MMPPRKTAGRRAVRALLAATATAGLLAGVAFTSTSPAAADPQRIVVDQAAKTVTMTAGGYQLVYDYDHASTVSSFRLGDTQLLDKGMYSAVTLDGDGSSFDSRTLASDPSVHVTGNVVTASFAMGNDDLSLAETWRFNVTPGKVDVRVSRTYHWLDTANLAVRHNGLLTIGWARVWDNIRRPEDGGNLPLGNDYTGTNNFFLTQPTDRYGVEESRFVMLRNASKQALDVTATSDRSLATEFAYTGDGNTYQETQVSTGPTWSYTGGTKAQGYVYGGHSSNATNHVIYAPVTTTQDQTDTVDYEFSSDDYATYYSLGGTVNGVKDPTALSSMLNDFGRSGVIDKGYGMSTVGLRYPGVGPYDMVYASPTVQGSYDPAMTASQKNLLEYFRDYAQSSNGHMKGRTYHLDHPWGDSNLYDADAAYAMAVSDMYQYAADPTWLASMRSSVERSIAYMVDNSYVAADGLFRNDITTCSGTKSIREWNDAFYIKWESGYINELMYKALSDWAGLEQTVFGDADKAASYRAMAEKLKEQFNKDAADGGLWDPGTGMFAYWRCPDGTVYGKVEHTQINLQAINFGMVDVQRARKILAGIDKNMQRFHLPLIPQNFIPFKPTTEDWTGDHFTTSLEDGPIYPLMTQEYMRAAAMVGERDRSLTYLNNAVSRYTKDGYNNFSFLDWNLGVHGGEAWFPSNANAGTGLFTDVLGIEPTAEGVTVAPNIPSSMNGTKVTKAIHADDSLTVTYHDELSQTVDYSSATQPVTLQWSGQTPSATYSVNDNGTQHTVTADSFGIVRYTYTGSGAHAVRLTDGNADGYVLPNQVPTDLALGKPVTATSSREDINGGISRLTDGQPYSVDKQWGWSSDSNLAADHTESVTVDLGANQNVGAVTLWPRNYDMKLSDLADDFPIDFTIAVSTDGTTWTTVADETNYPKPSDGSAQTFSFDQRPARYVRVEGTKLRNDSDTNDSTSWYRMELAELEVFSTAPPAV
jgi:hypothetical protein